MAKLQFELDDDFPRLLLHYTPDYNIDKMIEKIQRKEPLKIKNTFWIPSDLVLHYPNPNDNDETFTFEIGREEDDYIKIYSEVTNTSHVFYFSIDIELCPKMFFTNNHISILRKIDEIIDRDLYVGGKWEKHDGIPEEVYQNIIACFPSSTELMHYTHNRIAIILKNYFDECDQYENIYNKYIAKKEKKNATIFHKSRIDTNLRIEYEQFSVLLNHLNDLLHNSAAMSEKQWQYEIKKILFLIYPQYIYSTREVRIPGIDQHQKQPDFILVDANGFIDVLEIKKPEVQLLTSKPSYRNNYIPLRELAGAVVQIEKYIFYLNNMNPGNNEVCTELKKELPPSVNPQIVAPKGLLLLGRSDGFEGQKKRDFEIIKRQYKHIVDIMTYDDLMQRLDNIIKGLQIRIDGSQQKQ